MVRSKWFKISVAALISSFILVIGMGNGWFGTRQDRGENVKTPRSAAFNKKVAEAQTKAGATDKQILFGDLHVHTTFSVDAFSLSLPIVNGEGSHPPADACDFARFCSALDFWSINDHAEGLTSFFWQETKEAVRQCNAVSGDENNPDMVTFLGWEWTQVGTTPKNHYGHKNVILLETAEDKVPKRPIASSPPPGSTMMAMKKAATFGQRLGIGLSAPFAPGSPASAYLDATTFFTDIAGIKDCPEGVNSKELPVDCRESAFGPDTLFKKLKEWGGKSMVIPHGTTWGFYTPAGSNWTKQLKGAQHDSSLQTLFEVFSGHGNSERFRNFKAAAYDAQGKAICPQPTPEYLPSCWRAGEIIYERCKKVKLDEKECQARAQTARDKLSQSRHSRAPDCSGHEPRRLARCRPVQRLHSAHFQLQARWFGSVCVGHLELRRSRKSASL